MQYEALYDERLTKDQIKSLANITSDVSFRTTSTEIVILLGSDYIGNSDEIISNQTAHLSAKEGDIVHSEVWIRNSYKDERKFTAHLFKDGEANERTMSIVIGDYFLSKRKKNYFISKNHALSMMMTESLDLFSQIMGLFNSDDKLKPVRNLLTDDVVKMVAQFSSKHEMRMFAEKIARSIGIPRQTDAPEQNMFNVITITVMVLDYLLTTYCQVEENLMKMFFTEFLQNLKNDYVYLFRNELVKKRLGEY